MKEKLRIFGLASMAPSMAQHIIPEPVTATRTSEIKNKIPVITNLKFNTAIDLMDWRPDSDHARFLWRFDNEKFVESLERGPSGEMRNGEWVAVTGESDELLLAEKDGHDDLLRLLQSQELENVTILPKISYDFIENIHGIAGPRLIPEWKSLGSFEELGPAASSLHFSFSNYYRFRFRRQRPNRRVLALGHYAIINAIRRRRRARFSRRFAANNYYYKLKNRLRREAVSPVLKVGTIKSFVAKPFSPALAAWLTQPLLGLTRPVSSLRHGQFWARPWNHALPLKSKVLRPLLRQHFYRILSQRAAVPPYILKKTKFSVRQSRSNDFAAKLQRGQSRSLASILRIFLFAMTHTQYFLKGSSARKLRSFLVALTDLALQRLQGFSEFHKPFANYLSRRSFRAALPRRIKGVLGGSLRPERTFVSAKVAKGFEYIFKRIQTVPKRLTKVRQKLYLNLSRKLRFAPADSILSPLAKLQSLSHLSPKPRLFPRRRSLATGLVATALPLLATYQRKLNLAKRLIPTFFGEFRDLFTQRYYNKISSLLLTYKLFEDEFEELEEAVTYDWFVGSDFMTGEDFCIYTNEGDKVLRSFKPSPPATPRIYQVFAPMESRKPKLGILLTNLVGATGYGPRARRWVNFHRHRRALRLAGLLSTKGTF